MRYSDRITLIRYSQDDDGLGDSPTSTKTENVPCELIPITNVQDLESFGLLSANAYEIHIKNKIALVNRVKIDGIEYTVNKTFLNRKSTVLIVSGGG
ncbi:hypothetical protein LB941_01020 [Ligilactobacillus sp. WILCCON 0076]|uniref:Phage protein n=1 Tax=Ligilactobacillus ubinensis TaxID=2876789 RepID=A0A9X2JKP0_9LACO|nr:hypothetical protein [Ligilactobacillus ubinensis]MCP0885915.1 hypothetical protein [Ligilactobacillus ubinensis]